MEKRVQKRMIQTALALMLILGGIVYNPQHASATTTETNINGTKVVIEDATYEYDGNYHGLKITISGGTPTITYTYTDEVTNAQKSSTNTPPTFREVGEHKVNIKIQIGTIQISGVNTVTITPSSNPGSGGGTGGKPDSGSGTNNTSNTTGKVNDKFTVSGITYQITKIGSSKEVTLLSGKNASKKVTIPDTVTYNKAAYKVTAVSKKAFSGNKKITGIVFGKNVSTIRENAFEKCTKLKSVTFSSKVKTIKKNAFNGCKALKTVKFTSKTPPSMGKNCFKGIHKKAHFKVPASAKSKYKKKLTSKAGWKKTMKVTS